MLKSNSFFLLIILRPITDYEYPSEFYNTIRTPKNQIKEDRKTYLHTA